MTRSLAVSALLAFASAALGGCEATLQLPSDAVVAAAAPPPRADAPSIPEGAAPLGALPPGVRPTEYTLVLDVRPTRDRVANAGSTGVDRFSGVVDIRVELAKPATTIWMHAKNLAAKSAYVRDEGRGDVRATLEQVDPSGVAALRTAQPVGPGAVVVHVEYDAPYGKNLQGLYKVEAGGEAYAFSQLESVFARQVFPSFDEPGFKVPFYVSVVVNPGTPVVANTHELIREHLPDGAERASFAITRPLPTYLLAFAVGPLDVVEMPPIPANAVRKQPLALRGVAAKGRGKDMRYALAHTGEILAALERWFGSPYPYDKLDIIAVPDKGGAMENPGALTFREWLVMLDPAHASVEQRRAYFYVMAHELAHQWTGDLVTMKWWDDTWLNEAFATFMGNKIAAEVAPELGTSASELERVHGAMGVDQLVSARSIRQPVRDTNDIANAFDSITYLKGGSVIGMFERWLGPDVFRAGVRSYLADHAYGNAGADDLLASLSRAASRDVGAPMRTFLDQPGTPLVEASVLCDAGAAKLHVKQSRYLPLGSTGSAEATWQVPVCARYPVGATTKVACALVAEKEADVPLGAACPAWVHPNADAVGYYRWTLAAADARRLAKAGVSALSTRERSSFVMSIRAGLARGTLSAGDALTALVPLAADPNPDVALAARDMTRSMTDWFAPGSPALAGARAFVASVYAPLYQSLGWQARTGAVETAERKLLRVGVVRAMADVAKDPAARKEAAARGRAYAGYGGDGAVHADAVDPNLATLALAVAVEDGDAALFDHLVALLGKSADEAVRVRILTALGYATTPALAERARALTLDPSLRGNEWATSLETQLGRVETRDAAWAFFRAHLDALMARPSRAAHLVTLGGVFCEPTRATELEAMWAPKRKTLEGAPRTLAETVENVRLCVARRAAQEPAARAFFTSRPPSTRRAP